MGNMSNVQFFVLLGTVLAGVIWQRVDYHQLSGRIDRLSSELTVRIDSVRSELNGRIDRISDDLKHFYRDLGRHEEALDNLKDK